jgi:hypothetical protein
MRTLLYKCMNAGILTGSDKHKVARIRTRILRTCALIFYVFVSSIDLISKFLTNFVV